MNGGRIVLLDHANLESQLLGLVWRNSRVDHPTREHEDFANAAAGALYLASKNAVLNAQAIPLAVGKGIGTELKQIGGGIGKPMFGGYGGGRLSEGFPTHWNYDGEDNDD